MFFFCCYYILAGDIIKQDIIVRLNQSIKQEWSNWYLYGVSEATEKSPPIRLRVGENTVGRSPLLNSIALGSMLCSRKHCELSVSENEVIMRDKNVR